MITVASHLTVIVLLFPVAFGAVDLLFLSLQSRAADAQRLQGVPGLSAREARDLLWLDWLLGEGVFDRGLLSRYVFLATRVDYELTDRALAVADVPDLRDVTCPWCANTWSVTVDCPMCRDAYGMAAPLARRPAVLGAS